MKQSPIFVRAHDLVLWILQTTRKFPREHRFGLALRLQNQGFELEDRLVAASLDIQQTADHLLQADIALANLRKTLLHCHDLGLLTPNQVRHAGEMAAEVGRMLGSWRSAPAGKEARPKPRVAEAGAGP